MKIQSLAVMFIIIVLPISIVMQTYIQSRVETLSLQSQYDSKLLGSTYDALKAYQLNSVNSDTSYLANSKMRDIEAGANTFFNSLSTNFSTLGYNKESLQGYVPALVFTMYDGYYIYSPYTNTWDDETSNIHGSDEDKTFYNCQVLYGLKPYIYYSCRYKKDNLDVVITYSMDSYVSIQGKKGNQTISLYGYVLDEDNDIYNKISTDDTLEDKLQREQVWIDGADAPHEYEYIKKNGTKYYIINNGNDAEVFAVLNGKKEVQKNPPLTKKNGKYVDDGAKKYYKNAQNLQSKIIQLGINELTVKDAVNVEGNSFTDLGDNAKIFDYGHKSGIEADDSNFNTHRIDVIKYTIEKNLSVAIKNYNNYSGAEKNVDFQMPKLKDSDWMKILDNLSIITFLQGMNVGGKIYNGYAVVTNTKNNDVVSKDSIYIKTGSVYHRPTENNLTTDDNTVGVFNVDLERKTAKDSNGNTGYYYPKEGTLSYDSIVTQNNVNSNNTINNATIKKIYYTALGRERYGQYRETIKIGKNAKNGDHLLNFD